MKLIYVNKSENKFVPKTCGAAPEVQKGENLEGLEQCETLISGDRTPAESWKPEIRRGGARTQGWENDMTREPEAITVCLSYFQGGKNGGGQGRRQGEECQQNQKSQRFSSRQEREATGRLCSVPQPLCQTLR